MIWFYRFLFFPIFFLAFPYYLYRMLKRGGYGKDFHHRFGLLKVKQAAKPDVKRVWIQAVSVGELLAVEPLIKGLKTMGNVEVFLTTTTSTGYAVASKRLSGSTIGLGIFPFDFWFFSAIAWNRIQPDIAILMESELWPEHIYQAASRQRPVLLVNARLSDKSYRRYRKFSFCGKFVFDRLPAVLAASKQDRDRFLQAGVEKSKLHLTGNLKFDVEFGPVLNAQERNALCREFGFIGEEKTSEAPLVILGSSTWPGEEAMLLETFNKALEEKIDCRLLIVPRHAERRGEIEALLKKQEHAWHFRSAEKQAPPRTKIYIGDTTGELRTLSQVADLAFIGKSLPPNKGGQTPIEAAALGIPILFGPEMANFRSVYDSLLAFGAAIKTSNTEETVASILHLLKTPEIRLEMCRKAGLWHQSNQGALEKTLRLIERFVTQH